MSSSVAGTGAYQSISSQRPPTRAGGWRPGGPQARAARAALAVAAAAEADDPGPGPAPSRAPSPHQASPSESAFPPPGMCMARRAAMRTRWGFMGCPGP